MTPAFEPMLNEFHEEAAVTKRVLADKLTWKPHPKSMSLGQLALHVARIPANLTRLTQLDEFDTSQASLFPRRPPTFTRFMPPSMRAFARPETT